MILLHVQLTIFNTNTKLAPITNNSTTATNKKTYMTTTDNTTNNINQHSNMHHIHTHNTNMYMTTTIDSNIKHY